MRCPDHLEVVLETIRGLTVSRTSIGPETRLAELSNYNSLFLARLVEELEDRIGAELPVELIVPENFSCPRRIAAMLDSLRGD